MHKLPGETFEEFEKRWWAAHPELAKTELAQNGQFDDLPYYDYEKRNAD